MGRRLPFAIRLTNVCLLLLRTTKRPFRIRPAPAIRSPDLRGLHPERFSRGRWGATTILICWCAPETEVVAHSGSRWAPPLARILELRTLLAWKSGASVCPTGYCHRPSKRTVESTRATRRAATSPHPTLDSGTLECKLGTARARGGPMATGPARERQLCRAVGWPPVGRKPHLLHWQTDY